VGAKTLCQSKCMFKIHHLYDERNLLDTRVKGSGCLKNDETSNFRYNPTQIPFTTKIGRNYREATEGISKQGSHHCMVKTVIKSCYYIDNPIKSNHLLTIRLSTFAKYQLLKMSEILSDNCVPKICVLTCN